MNNIHNKIEQIVAKVNGEEKGNAFLIDKNHAVTLKHCIKKEYEEGSELEVIFPINDKKKVIIVMARIDEKFDFENDELVLLKLNQELWEPEILLGTTKIMPYDAAEVFGYDANYRAEGRWTKLVSVGSSTVNPDFVQDMLFHVKDNNESNFFGLSGSPIIMGNYVIGIVSQETIENNHAISISGISINSSRNFFEKYGISIKEDIDVGKRNFNLALSAGGYNKKDNYISIGGEQAYQTKLQDKYLKDLENISLMHRRGDEAGAWKELKKQIIEMNDCEIVDDKVKAEYYLKMALWFIEDRNEIGKAQKQLEKAKTLNPGLDDSIYKALKLSRTENSINAEDLLEPVDSVPKFNIYLQICLNSRKVEKAYEKYEELCEVIAEDATTHYLLSVLEVFKHNFKLAMQHILEAIEIDKKIPFYYMMKGIILFWKALPSGIKLSDDIYPGLIYNGVYRLNSEQLNFIKEAREAYQKAYWLAENVENKEQMEFILTMWINTLSIDGCFQNEIMEPFQLLQKLDPFNVAVLLYAIYKKINLGEGVTRKTIDQRLKQDTNKVGYVIVLVELCLIEQDIKRAKQYLHEYKSLFCKNQYIDYWYEYIVKVETQKENLKEYEEDLIKNNNIEETKKKRLLCLFLQLDCEREQELEILLNEIYETTHNRLDLLNLIYFYSSKRKWDQMKEYSYQLTDIFDDMSGEIYKIKALIGLEEYDKALSVIKEVEDQCIINTYSELTWDKMIIYERQGRYSEAISSGMELLQKEPTEQLFLKISSLNALNGDEEGALNILLNAEEKKYLNVEICQRISICYLSINSRKAWDYAKKAVVLSKDQPEVMLWATEIANRVGKSDQASIYYHRIFTEYPNHQMMTVKSIDEVLEIIQESKKQMEEYIQMLYDGTMNSHLFVDAHHGNFTYAEFFYQQWNVNNMAPLEFGAHYYHDEILKKEIKEIALDYSSCLLMYEIDLLDILGEKFDKIYIPGELFGIISEEIRKIPVNQQDIVNKRYSLLYKCKNELNITFVDINIPIDIEIYNTKERPDVTSIATAKAHNAEWVTSDYNENSIWATEILTALYRENKISDDVFSHFQSNETKVREEKIEYLINTHPALLVDEIVLELWDEAYVLAAVHESYPILILKTVVEEIDKEKNEILLKEYICKQLVGLRANLLNLKELDKLFFLPIHEQENTITYSAMLISLLIGAEKRKIPVCIDDRMLTSYSHIGLAQIYNVFDIMKILLLAKNISLEQYCGRNKKLYDKKIRYVLPDNRYILYAMNLSEVDSERKILKESEMLTSIRKYLVEAFSDDSHMSHEMRAHIQLPEWEYFLFNLQGNSRELIRIVWNSNMSYEKKYSASEWVLYHYSQFAFDFGSDVPEKKRKLMQSIQLADFILTGLLFAVNEECTEKYFEWLFDWVEMYLTSNPDIRDRSINFTKEYINSYLRKCYDDGNVKETKITCWLLATGIYYMPEKYKASLLEDKMISGMYNREYSVINVVLTEERQIPVDTFKAWEKEALTNEENKVITKLFKDVCFEISWTYIFPAFPGLIIKWSENQINYEKRMYMSFGERLYHKDKIVRKSEFLRIKYFLNDIGYEKEYRSLLNQGTYKNAANDIVLLLDQSDAYEMLRIKSGLDNNWLNSKKTIKLMIPQKSDYFKKIYDYNEISEAENNKLFPAVPIHFNCDIQEIDCENKNPVRLLHQLWQALNFRDDSERIYELICRIFSYVKGTNEKYGLIYILFLKVAWKLFHECNNYKEESERNLICWSYIWADKAMTSIRELEVEKKLDLFEYGRKLEADLNINLEMDKFWDNMAEEDVLSPNYMNIFKLCITGTLVMCVQYKKAIQGLEEKIITYFTTNLQQWMNIGVYVREIELAHKNDKNMFSSIFAENVYTLINRISLMAKGESPLNTDLVCNISDRISFCLQNILEGDKIDAPELVYLFVLSRENMEAMYVDLFEQIIEKHILNKAFVFDKLRYRLLSHIVLKVSDDFRDKYLRYEYMRIKMLLQKNQQDWEILYDIIAEISQITSPDRFLSFWEDCESILVKPISLQMVEQIGWLQFSLPYKYSERVRKLRIKLELKT